MSTYIHESAFVEPRVHIGDGTHIWHQVQLRSGCVIGKECNIGKNCYIDASVIIGDRVKIQNNVSVYQGVRIQDDVFVGPSAVFTNDHYPRAFDPEWQITDTLIMRGASIGANATIVCGHTVGPYAMIGAGSVVTHHVPSHALVIGNPARRVGWVCKCGRKLNNNGQCSCGRSYDLSLLEMETTDIYPADQSDDI